MKAKVKAKLFFDVWIFFFDLFWFLFDLCAFAFALSRCERVLGFIYTRVKAIFSLIFVTLRSVHAVRFALRKTAVLYMRFCEIVHTVLWIWMRFAMYLHLNRTSQLHRICMEPIHVWHCTQVCITHRASHTMWTVSLTYTIQFLYLKNCSWT